MELASRSLPDYDFGRPDGGPLDRSAVRSRFICAQERAGVRVRRFHDLRHSFGSLRFRSSTSSPSKA